MKKLYPLILLLLPAMGIIAQDFSFYKENITMKIESHCFYVSGKYYLKGNINSSCLLMFPFPADSIYGKPDSIYIFSLTDNERIDFEKKNDRKLFFRVEFKSGSEFVLQISYKQELLGTRAEYIIETTRMWHEPLLQADYQLIIPDSLKITRFSIHPDDSIKANNETVYFWTKTNYMPAENMVFDFEIKENYSINLPDTPR